MKSKMILAAGLAVVALCLVASLMNDWHRGDPEQTKVASTVAKPPNLSPARPSTSVALAAAVDPEQPSKSGDGTPTEPVKATVSVKDAQSTAKTTINQAATSANTGPDDPVARVALSFVGADPDAEQYWEHAINDPSLSADERQNLIEDLNEDGLSDFKHPGPQDLPLILNRLRLIEELAPYALDQVNYDAFAEAYKDLVNLANLSVGSGEPVN